MGACGVVCCQGGTGLLGCWGIVWGGGEGLGVCSQWDLAWEGASARDRRPAAAFVRAKCCSIALQALCLPSARSPRIVHCRLLWMDRVNQGCRHCHAMPTGLIWGICRSACSQASHARPYQAPRWTVMPQCRHLLVPARGLSWLPWPASPRSMSHVVPLISSACQFLHGLITEGLHKATNHCIPALKAFACCPEVQGAAARYSVHLMVQPGLT